MNIIIYLESRLFVLLSNTRDTKTSRLRLNEHDSKVHGDEDTTTWKQRKFLVTSNLLYNFHFMTNLKNSYVFPLDISFHDKLDTALTPSSKDEEMI